MADAAASDPGVLAGPERGVRLVSKLPGDRRKQARLLHLILVRITPDQAVTIAVAGDCSGTVRAPAAARLRCSGRSRPCAPGPLATVCRASHRTAAANASANADSGWPLTDLDGATARREVSGCMWTVLDVFDLATDQTVRP